MGMGRTENEAEVRPFIIGDMENCKLLLEKNPEVYNIVYSVAKGPGSSCIAAGLSSPVSQTAVTAAVEYEHVELLKLLLKIPEVSLSIYREYGGMYKIHYLSFSTFVNVQGD